MSEEQEALAHYPTVMHANLQDGTEVYLLANGEHGYAVCQADRSRGLVFVPNFNNQDGLLTAPMTREGMNGLLQWTSRAEALTRYSILTQSSPVLRGMPHG